MKIIVFNGAPRSGKDTFGSLLKQDLNVFDEYLAENHSFKEIMFDIILNLFMITRQEWFERYEEQKEEPWDKLRGMSQRQALIALSEQGLKNAFGQDIFGFHMAEKLKYFKQDAEQEGFQYFAVFTDCGFQVELDCLKAAYGAENIMLVRLHREGFDFSNDSRSLLEDNEIHTIDVKSEGLGETFDVIKAEVLKWVR